MTTVSIKAVSPVEWRTVKELTRPFHLYRHLSVELGQGLDSPVRRVRVDLFDLLGGRVLYIIAAETGIGKVAYPVLMTNNGSVEKTLERIPTWAMEVTLAVHAKRLERVSVAD